MSTIDPVLERPLITITEAAAVKIAEIIAAENDPEIKLRIYVEGGGCSGLKYEFVLDSVINDDDFVISQGGIVVLVDPLSLSCIEGAEIDYITGIEERLTMHIPNAIKTCGCGSSFSVE